MILPKEVSKISMEFNTKIYGGHRGARYVTSIAFTPSFWEAICSLVQLAIVPQRPGLLYTTKEAQSLTQTTYRKFWRIVLPRIKYRNPSVPIEISRHNAAEGPSLLHIYMKSLPNTPDGSSNTSVPSLHTQSATATTPPSGTPNTRNTLVPDATAPTHTINIRDLQHSEILDALLAKLPDSQILRPTPEEEQQMAELAEQKERSDADRVMVRERLMKERREAELLRLARGEITATA